MGKSSLPPGFRFHPTHVELILFYLKRKVTQKELPPGVISELDIYKHAPWDLPDKSCLKSRDLKWYFFCPRERKYASGARMNRATELGFWKSTGRDKPINHNNKVVGHRKTLTFFKGKPPKGTLTDWVIHEYRIEEKDLSEVKDSYVLCVIFQKDGPGPRNGAQYGAPFKEEEWDDDGVEEVDCLEVDHSAGPSMPSLLPPSKEPQSSIHPEFSVLQGNIFTHISESNGSDILVSTFKEVPQIAGGNISSMDIPQNLDDDDMFSFQEFFPEERQHMNYDNGNQNTQNVMHGTVTAPNHPDPTDIYKDLEDLRNFERLNEDRYADSAGHEAMYCAYHMFPSNEAITRHSYLELRDLEAPLSSAEGKSYAGIETSSLTAAYNPSNTIEQPCSSSVPFGAVQQHVPSNLYSLLHNSNVEVDYLTTPGFPEQHISAPSQNSWQESFLNHDSNAGCSSYKDPWT